MAKKWNKPTDINEAEEPQGEGSPEMPTTLDFFRIAQNLEEAKKDRKQAIKEANRKVALMQKRYFRALEEIRSGQARLL